MRILRVLVGASLLAGCSLDASGSAEAEDFADSIPVGADTELPPPDVTLEDTSSPPEDSGTPDTFVADTFVADTFVADTYVADTFVADTFVADTFVADTYVADTYVADTLVPDTRPDTLVTDMGVDAGPAPCSEPNAVRYTNGHCYFIVGSARSWTSARDACAAASTTGHPTYLAVITTMGEWTHVNGLVGGTGYARWLGLSAPSASSVKANYKWGTGEAFAYDAWMTGHPDSSGACVAMHSPTFMPTPGSWEDLPCTNTIPYVCERE